MQAKLFTDEYIKVNDGVPYGGTAEYQPPQFRWKMVDEQINEFLGSNTVEIKDIRFTGAYSPENMVIIFSALVLYEAAEN